MKSKLLYCLVFTFFFNVVSYGMKRPYEPTNGIESEQNGPKKQKSHDAQNNQESNGQHKHDESNIVNNLLAESAPQNAAHEGSLVSVDQVKKDKDQSKSFFSDIDSDVKKAVATSLVVEHYLNRNGNWSDSPFGKKMLGLVSSLKQIVPGSGQVQAVAYNPNGETIICGGVQGSPIKLSHDWSEMAALLARVNGESIPLTDTRKILFSPDGIISVLICKSVIRKQFGIEKKVTVSRAPSEVQFFSGDISPDGKSLVFSFGTSLYIFQDILLADSHEIPGITHSSCNICDVKFTPDGSRLVTCALKDKTIKVWDLARKTLVATLSGHDAPVNSLAFTADENRLISCSADKTIKIWDMTSYKELTTLAGHDNTVYGLAVSPDQKLLASTSRDKTVRIWDLVHNKQLFKLSGFSGMAVWPVAFSPDGQYLVVGSNDTRLTRFNVKQLLDVYTELPTFMRSLYETPDGLQKFFLLRAIFVSKDNKDFDGNKKQSKPFDIYNPKLIALLESLPDWLKIRLQEAAMVRVFKKKEVKNVINEG